MHQNTPTSELPFCERSCKSRLRKIPNADNLQELITYFNARSRDKEIASLVKLLIQINSCVLQKWDFQGFAVKIN